MELWSPGNPLFPTEPLSGENDNPTQAAFRAVLAEYGWGNVSDSFLGNTASIVGYPPQFQALISPVLS
ncbi:hypothetical protein [Candidatus Contendibacter odensensis]|uniref:Uncharacterized protein n=1 Tax=Candidatus Contendobacter odensis Run_B_J11 TaxID=1400861 RepID=A0A7U7J675_9GAMM|nr:hypothetical protein [Candidatus Contendobacter odensis]MBK8753150.1 hypothetical protein [Candidatus Competibacteraceae bacterium]CDH47502.1 hypothetical protein BN874_830055 [Candidatus Contendobacter odensis Run_B_J11]